MIAIVRPVIALLSNKKTRAASPAGSRGLAAFVLRPQAGNEIGAAETLEAEQSLGQECLLRCCRGEALLDFLLALTGRVAMAELLKDEKIAIEAIYVPTKRRSTLDPKKVDALAEAILEKGQQSPILVRRDGERFVLVEGLHRLEAMKALGEARILATVVQARRG
jgi:hypothetical protein